MSGRRWVRLARRAGLGIAVVGAAAAWWVHFGIPGVSRGDEVRVFVRKGAPFREAAESLAAQGVIGSPRLFGAYANARGIDRSLRWGTYILRERMPWEAVLTALRLGKGVVRTVTIPEGWTLAEIAPAIATALDVPEDSVLAAARDSVLRQRLRVPTGSLEGYLFPDTYAFPVGATARDAVRTMVARFEAQWQPAWDSILPRLRMTRHGVVTLASIVEREVRVEAERPIVSGVYHNRLRIRMPLQADPTIDYALGRKPGRVLLKDLRVDSPYNTYRNPGLPPGPIGSPGIASIRAALEPANVPYRYFVAGPDGRHEFRRTYAEHLEAIRMVRRRPAPVDSGQPAPAGRTRPDPAPHDLAAARP